ncbi:MAG TPA: thiol-disulfide oxidoreductase DCC family protein [Ferruginibacter sp.]|nr:thiol-disulfide oxidoreductase DCC family protein [Ferruginibacter sp.]HPH91732.1 thiol-disulfide oxidoreductase DCC family protein [Ferruginibacter sp.]
MTTGPVILFDGICNFCNGAVNFTIKRDKRKVIKFAALQTEIGKTLLQQHGLPENYTSSFIFIENGKLYNRSTAALRVCRYLSGLWPLCYGLIIVPAFIRNAVYDFIAKNRYKWFGQKDACMIPTPEMRARFL